MKKYLKLLIPEEYLKDFDANSVENKPTEWVIELVEKEDRVPAAHLLLQHKRKTNFHFNFLRIS